MKSIMIAIMLTITFKVSASNEAKCYQHDQFVGLVYLPINNEEVIGYYCFTTYSDLATSKAIEIFNDDDEYSPECWKGKKEGGGIGHGEH